MKKILKKSHKRGYKKTYNILKYIIPNLPKVNKITNTNKITDINELVEIENKQINLINEIIKKQICLLKLKNK